MSRVVNDTAHFEALIAHAIPEATVSILTIFGVFIALFSINGQLALYTLVPIPLIVAGFIMYNRYVRPLFRHAQAMLGDLNSALQDNLSGIREIQVFTQEEREMQRVENRILSHASAITRAVSISACFHGGIDFFAGLGTVAVALFGGLMALKGQISLCRYDRISTVCRFLLRPVMRLNHLNGLFSRRWAADHTSNYLIQSRDQDTPDAIDLKDVQGNAFENVDYYDETPY